MSAGLIPFLEHDDANRALMGSNMQRQAVPLLVAEPPIVATGLERAGGDATRAWSSGPDRTTGRSPTSTRAASGSTSSEHVPAQVRRPQRAYLPEPEADRQDRRQGEEGAGAGRRGGDGARASWPWGGTSWSAFMSWEGYNFEDAIIISERLVENDTYTSIHIENFEIEIRETKLGKEEFTKDIPNVSPKALNGTWTSTGSCGSARSCSRATSWSARWRRSPRAS